MRFEIRPGVRRLLRFPIRTRAAMKSDAMDVVTPNWFSLMHVRLVRGRPFSPADRPDGPKVVLLNEQRGEDVLRRRRSDRQAHFGRKGRQGRGGDRDRR